MPLARCLFVVQRVTRRLMSVRDLGSRFPSYFFLWYVTFFLGSTICAQDSAHRAMELPPACGDEQAFLARVAALTGRSVDRALYARVTAEQTGYAFHLELDSGSHDFHAESCPEGVEAMAVIFATALATGEPPTETTERQTEASARELARPGLPLPSAPTAADRTPTQVRLPASLYGFVDGDWSWFGIRPGTATTLGASVGARFIGIGLRVGAGALLPTTSAAVSSVQTEISGWLFEVGLSYELGIIRVDQVRLTLEPELQFSVSFLEGRAIGSPTSRTQGTRQDAWGLGANLYLRLQEFFLRAGPKIHIPTSRRDFILEDGTVLYRTGDVGFGGLVAVGVELAL